MEAEEESAKIDEETEFRKKIEKLTKLYEEISNAGWDTTQIEDEMASAFATAHQSAQTEAVHEVKSLKGKIWFQIQKLKARKFRLVLTTFYEMVLSFKIQTNSVRSESLYTLRCQINESTRLAFFDFCPTLLVYLALLLLIF